MFVGICSGTNPEPGKSGKGGSSRDGNYSGVEEPGEPQNGTASGVAGVAGVVPLVGEGNTESEPTGLPGRHGAGVRLTW